MIWTRDAEEALRKSKELGQDLSVRLGPLEQDVQRLELQRACLEDRMVLMERDRGDCKAQYEVSRRKGTFCKWFY
jgi:syncoilin-1